MDDVCESQNLLLSYSVNEDGSLSSLNGVESIFLTNSTVEICELTSLLKSEEEDFTELAKDKILSDIQFRGAISDFHPIKAKIQSSDYDPLLIKSNEEDRYGDGNNFEIALTREAADCWIEVRDRIRIEKTKIEAERNAKELHDKTPRFKRKRIAKPWISQGSELEIENQTKYTTRPVLTFQRRGRDFNQKLELMRIGSEKLWSPNEMECWPFNDEENCTLDRILHHSGVQSVPNLIDKGIQITGEKSVIQSTQYTPQQSNGLDVKDEGILKEVLSFLEELEPRWNEELICGGIVDLLEDEFGFQIDDQELNTSEQKETILTELNSLTDITFSKSRRIVHLEWSPHKQGILAAISVDSLSFERRSEEHGRPKDYALVEWDISNPMKPTRFLYSDQELTSFNYHPIQDPLIAAGTYTGQIVIWTESDRGLYTHCSSIESSHNAPITALEWIPGFEIDRSGNLTLLESQKECFAFVTLSTDGKLLFWDLRLEKHLKKAKQVDFDAKKCMKPIFEIPFFGSEGGDLTLQNLSFPLSLSNPEIKVSTTAGTIILGNLSKAQGDNPEITEDLFQAHSGPVVCLARSPFFSDVYLTAGGWTFKLWRDGHRDSIFTSSMSPHLYTSGVWSPSRPGLIGLTTEAGSLEIWDLLEKTNQCSLSWNVGSIELSSLVFSNEVEGRQNLQYLAVGDVQGTVHLLRVPRSLRRPLPEEKKLMAKLLHHQLTTLEQRFQIPENDKVQNQENEDPSKEKLKKLEALNEGDDYDQLEKEMRIQLGLGDEENTS